MNYLVATTSTALSLTVPVILLVKRSVIFDALGAIDGCVVPLTIPGASHVALTPLAVGATSI